MMQFKYYQKQTVLWDWSMVFSLIFIATLIVVERYANRSDTKKILEHELKIDDDEMI